MRLHDPGSFTSFRSYDKLLADLEPARQSGNPTKVAKVNRRLDRLLDLLGEALDADMGEVVLLPRRRLAGRHVRSVKVRCG